MPNVLIRAGVSAVDEAVAVVVAQVANLGRDRVYIRVGVVAVVVVVDVAGRHCAGERGRKRIAIVVDIRVGVPGERVDRIVFVDCAVAVIVVPVAVFAGTGVGRRLRVVAIGIVGDETGRDVACYVRGRGIAETIGVGVVVPRRRIGRIVLVRGAVAVVVVAVAVLGRTREGRGLRIVAVRRIRGVAGRHCAGQGRGREIAEAITVAVCVPGEGVERIIFVRRAVAVVIHRIAQLVCRGVNVVVGVVAIGIVGNVSRRDVACYVRGRGIAEAIAVGIFEPDRRIDRVVLVRGAIAVVVDRVAGLGSARARRRLVVIAVRRVARVSRRDVACYVRRGGVAVAITVRIAVPGGHVESFVFVDVAIAVVVVPVAVFVCVGVGVSVGVVAVEVVDDTRFGHVAPARGSCRVSEPVIVAVRIPDDQSRVWVIAIDEPIAVVVLAVAELPRFVVNRGIRVIAVIRPTGIALRLIACEDSLDVLRTVAVRIAVREPLGSIDRTVFVDVAIAVVVHTIAVLC